MSETKNLSDEFELLRPHLRGVAFRILGSLGEADDAVQESWLRLRGANVGEIENLGGYLTRVVARICLDALRSRKARARLAEDVEPPTSARSDPAREAELADQVGAAMMVVLNRLTPGERIAFVLHDLFDVSFDEIAGIVGRSAEATRQLASRGRRRVRGEGRAEIAPDLARHREAVEAYVAASRAGDFAALLAVLDPDVVARNGAESMLGATAVAGQAIKYRAKLARVCLIDGVPGLIVAPRGRLKLAVRFDVRGGRIARIEVVSGPAADALAIAPID